MEAVELENPSPPPEMDDSCCSTPYVSAPSSPTRAGANTGFYYSAPASPMHFLLSTNATLNNSSSSAAAAAAADSFDFDFDFSAPKFSSASADELFSNGQIRPMNLLSPLLESNDGVADNEPRGREMKQRAGSLRRRTRSMSPPRHATSKEQNNVVLEEAAPCASRSRRWVFLKELLYRSKSEGRNDGHDHRSSKFWNTVSFSPVKKTTPANNKAKGGGKRRSAHEVHYAAKRAEAEEMRKKTFLPYRQGLFGCLGFSSKSYGAMSNGFARALNPVSSR